MKNQARKIYILYINIYIYLYNRSLFPACDLSFVASNLGFLERREEGKKKATKHKRSLTSQSSSNAAVGVASCERVDSVELDDNDVNVIIDDENEEVRDPREEEEDIDVRIHINVDEEEENDDEKDADSFSSSYTLTRGEYIKNINYYYYY